MQLKIDFRSCYDWTGPIKNPRSGPLIAIRCYSTKKFIKKKLLLIEAHNIQNYLYKRTEHATDKKPH